MKYAHPEEKERAPVFELLRRRHLQCDFVGGQEIIRIQPLDVISLAKR